MNSRRMLSTALVLAVEFQVLSVASVTQAASSFDVHQTETVSRHDQSLLESLFGSRTREGRSDSKPTEPHEWTNHVGRNFYGQ